MDHSGLLSPAGLLSFFWSPAGWQVGHSAVLYSPPGTSLTRRDPGQADPREGLTLLLQVDSDEAARMAWVISGGSTS